MVHPLVDQLRFTRSEFQRGFKDVTEEDGQAHLGPMNSISWVIAHVAWLEERYFITFATGSPVVPQLEARVGVGQPRTTPTMAEAWETWTTVTTAADPYLDGLTGEMLLAPPPYGRHGGPSLAGNQLQRVIYHYWYHLGEAQAIRQQLGHQRLPKYIGDIDHEAPYRPA